MNWNGPIRKRPLTAEEAELWAFAMREARALRREQTRQEAGHQRRAGAEAAPIAPPPAKAPAPPRKPANTHDDPATSSRGTDPGRPASPAKSPPPLARYNERERRKLSRDAELIDARLDLHGMRQREAHGALRRFLLACHSRGDRHVLVITGKGAPAETGIARHFTASDERGVLRRLVPQWLADADLRSLVVSYAAASARHGGEGALYVRLRKAPLQS
jgi:DNA-nicking Smr family endonuclease